MLAAERLETSISLEHAVINDGQGWAQLLDHVQDVAGEDQRDALLLQAQQNVLDGSLVTASIPSKGSSKKMRRGRWMSAAHSASFFFMPKLVVGHQHLTAVWVADPARQRAPGLSRG